MMQAPWGGCRPCERKGSRGHHQWCCDITGGGIEGKGPSGQPFVFLRSLVGCVTLVISGSSCQTPQTPCPVHSTEENHRFMNVDGHTPKGGAGRRHETHSSLNWTAGRGLYRSKGKVRRKVCASPTGNARSCVWRASMNTPSLSAFPSPPLSLHPFLSFPFSFSLRVFRPFCHTSLPHHFLFHFILLPFSQLPLLPVSSLLLFSPLLLS